jgi:hypothetical protein
MRNTCDVSGLLRDIPSNCCLPTATLLVNVYRSYTPSFVRRLLARAGNAVLQLLEHPWLNTLALLLTKTLRTLLCLWTFGLEAAQWERVRDSILGLVDPGRHFPILSALLDTIGVLLGCLRDVLPTLDVFSCAGRLAGHVGLGLPKKLVLLLTNATSGLLGSVGGPLRGVALCVDSLGSLLTGYAGGSVSLTGLLGIFVNTVTMGAYVSDREDAAETLEAGAAVTMAHPMYAVFQDFYKSSAQDLTAGVVLWPGYHWKGGKSYPP